MNAPKLRFKDFNDEWESFTLGNLTALSDGTHFTPNYKLSGIPFWSVETITKNAPVKYISEEEHEEINKRCNPQINDILITRISSGINSLGLPKLVDWDTPFSIYVSVGLIKSSKLFDSTFLVEYIKTPKYKRDFLSKSLLTASPKKINMNNLATTLVKLPPLPEQKKLGDFFSLLEKKIQLQQEKIDLLKEQKKGFMQKIFSQELRFKDVNGRECPKWENKKIGDIATITMGQSPNSTAYSDNSSDTVLVQGNADLKLGKIVPRIYTSEITKMSELGDILLTVRAPVGVVAKTNIPACIGRGVCSIQSDDFLYYYLDYFNMTDQWNKLSQGSTFESVNSNDIKSIYVPQPSIKEKQKITSFFELLTKEIDLAESSLIELQKQKQAFMQQMFI
ncbi:restriction endonuclease subunit S [Solibacillus sp. A46]|uniref:Restriction endonuclease subunit S n=1 Tax=Solibacillus faecavium TaxID=2762221 RepID=A0ABR8Y3N7_9BACL|nr:restriction endonuclease subunit S [Solibacillus faecavium]MBD8038723.1 restriction endonuclease subunit S [Solibacillus faecavium]